jgi:hypothetical protein
MLPNLIFYISHLCEISHKRKAWGSAMCARLVQIRLPLVNFQVFQHKDFIVFNSAKLKVI